MEKLVENYHLLRLKIANFMYQQQKTIHHIP